MSHFGLDKSKENLFKKTLEEILKSIKPSTKQTSEEQKFVDLLLKRIKDTPGKHIDAIVAGSFARNTNLKDNKDFDIFVLYPPTLDRREFVEEGLLLGREVFKGYFCEKVFSEHPYTRGIIDNYVIEVVPAYKIQDTSLLISSVDRTPFHSVFISKNIKSKQKDDVRLLKFFLKTINCYGSDSEVNGFSGYLCELLVLYYGDFQGVLEAASNWNLPLSLNLEIEDKKNKENENNQEAVETEANKTFNEPFVFIDPVDKNRNVASAVEIEQISKFTAASRSFLQNPITDFFNKLNSKKFSYTQFITWLDNYPTCALEFDVKGLTKDIIWSKLKKNAKKIIANLEANDFNILKNGFCYSDEESKAYLFIMVDSLTLPKLKIHLGPKVEDIVNSQNYLDNTIATLGPYIKQDRWYSIKLRPRIDIKDVIMEFAFKNTDLPMKIFTKEEVKSLFLGNTNLASNFADFYSSKEKFLL
ncbi:MAG: CCA tRNA nucleotidyltransferase [archaeon]